MAGIEEYAGLLGRVAAIEQVIAFILARDDVRTGGDVLGILSSLKAQTLTAAAQAGDAQNLDSFPLGIEQGFDEICRWTNHLRTILGDER